MKRPYAPAALAAVLASLAVTATADAAVTTSTVTMSTATSNPFFAALDRDLTAPGSNEVVFSGTSNGGGADQVDVRCYNGNDGYTTVATGVAVNPDGSFSTGAAPLSSIADDTCTLRALPSGANPVDLTPYGGPVLGTSSRRTNRISGGPNDGAASDFYIYQAQLKGAMDWDSASSCGLADSYLYGANFREYNDSLFYCNAYFTDDGVRPGLVVDGHTAYDADKLRSTNSDVTGFVPLQYSYTTNPATGDMSIVETQTLTRCTDGGGVAQDQINPGGSCVNAVDTGVKLVRTITQGKDGLQATINDAFTSTNGQPHSISLVYEHDFDSDESPAYKLPGEGVFSERERGDIVSGYPASGSILIDQNSDYPEGSLYDAQGATTYSAFPDRTIFGGDDYYYDYYLDKVVPATGELSYRFAFTQGVSQAAVAGLSQEAERTFNPPPPVVAAAPAPAPVAVVNKPLPPAKTCKVPSVRGKTLKAARSAITKAGCKVGTVSTRRSVKYKTGRIVVQGVKAGRTVKAGTKVTLRVSKQVRAKRS